MKYTSKQLKRYQIADVLTDIRCAYRDNMPEYAITCEREALDLAGKQSRMDQYGYFGAVTT